jgi:glycosyltransferase involved in cell wall biosynthesis
MKVVLIAPQSIIHTVRWANAIIKHVEELHLITLHSSNKKDKIDSDVIIHKLRFKAPYGYILNIFEVQKLIAKIKPDIIHVHSCSGHGTMISLTNIKNYLLSIYGSDIYEFPQKSFLNKQIIRFNLSRAGFLASTSNAMALETKKYTNKDIYITPFGVDVDEFDNRRMPFHDKNEFRIGLVKALKEKYGIEHLIRAIPILNKKFLKNGIKKELLVKIYGKGEQKEKLVNLVNELQLNDIILFPGYISNNEVSSVLNEFDIVCIPSESESFGVSAVESMACERPVIVSDVDGLKEVVSHEESGIVVPSRNPNAIASAIFSLLNDKDYAIQLGINGRKRVLELYDWDKNVKHMIDVYDEICSEKSQ